MDERRQYYRLTPRGRDRLAAETALLARWVDAARRKDVPVEGDQRGVASTFC